MLLREDWDSVSHSEFSHTDSLSDHLHGTLEHTQQKKNTHKHIKHTRNNIKNASKDRTKQHLIGTNHTAH